MTYRTVLLDDESRVVISDYNHPTKCGGCGSKNGHWNGAEFSCYDCRLRTVASKPTAEDYNAPERCEWCGKGIYNGSFSARTGYAEGPFNVGDCCGDRPSGQLKDELLGPLLRKQ